MTLGANIAGREAELAELRGLLDAVEALPRASLILGEAGIGKTTLWRGAIDSARARGYRVLEAAPVETEAGFAYAALGDLLEGALDEALPELSEPQARALRIALLLDEPRGRRPEPRAIALGLLGVLRALARSGPVLVAVDDAHWLDTSSAAALAFAVRRLREEPVALVVAQRPGGGPGLADALAEERLLRIELGPLSVGALHRVLRDRLGRSFPRPFLRRLQQASGGNAFHALEIARELPGANAIAAGEPLPVPRGLDEILRGRLSALPADTARVLAAASLHAQPTLAALDALSGDAREQLQPALDAGIVLLDGVRIRFTHPLFASTIASSLDAH